MLSSANFTPAESWLRMSEALARDGKTEDAVGILQNAVRRYPGDPQLWIGLGNALVDHARGLTPPAELAYRTAARARARPSRAALLLWPRAGAVGRSRGRARVWREMLADAPPDASWRPLVEQGSCRASTASAPRSAAR